MLITSVRLSRGVITSPPKVRRVVGIPCQFFIECTPTTFKQKATIKVDDYSHFEFFLRDQNSQHFNEDLVAVNTSAFSCVFFFKAIDYTGASHYVISAK